MAMPDNNEVQGVLCGTCGQPRSSSAHTSYGAAIDHRFIPAPVVPSDERRQCWEVFSTTAIGASVIKWHCKLEKGHDGDHMGAQIHAAAPPTHSQDAEGYGLAEFVPDHAYAGGFDDGYEVGYQEAESAIRAPYEELVAALDAALAEAHPHFHPFNCEVCRIKAQEIRPRKAALESLGGRS